jgi:hypothetical protein
MKITTIGLDLAKTVFHMVGQDEGCRRQQTIPGYGLHRGRRIYRCGRRWQCLSARTGCLGGTGLAPAQHSSGGKDRSSGISKRGDRHVRSLWVPGCTLGGPAGGGQEGPTQPLDQPHPPGSWHQQGRGGPGQQDGPYRLGDIAPRHPIPSDPGVHVVRRISESRPRPRLRDPASGACLVAWKPDPAKSSTEQATVA